MCEIFGIQQTSYVFRGVLHFLSACYLNLVKVNMFCYEIKKFHIQKSMDISITCTIFGFIASEGLILKGLSILAGDELTGVECVTCAIFGESDVKQAIIGINASQSMYKKTPTIIRKH